MIANKLNVVSSATASPSLPDLLCGARGCPQQIRARPPPGTHPGTLEFKLGGLRPRPGVCKALRGPLAQAPRPRERCEDMSIVARLFAGPSGGRPLQASPPGTLSSPTE